jgi:phage tail-like protein
MSQPPLNSTSVEPLENFKFKVQWDGNYVVGVSKVSPLVKRTEAIFHREGGDPSTSHKSPGRTEYDPITLERGVTQDTAFEDWANQTWTLGAALGSEVSLANFRKAVRLEVYNEAGQLVKAYKIFNCWVSQYQVLSELDANSNAILIERIRLENEGWERDTSVAEPAQPSF